MGIRPAERKRGRLIVIASRAVIAAKERRPNPIIRVEDAIAIVTIARYPITVTGGVGGDREKDRVLPVWPPMHQAVTPGAKAIMESLSRNNSWLVRRVLC
jgi:hypothetical protein